MAERIETGIYATIMWLGPRHIVGNGRHHDALLRSSVSSQCLARVCYGGWGHKRSAHWLDDFWRVSHTKARMSTRWLHTPWAGVLVAIDVVSGFCSNQPYSQLSDDTLGVMDNNWHMYSSLRKVQIVAGTTT